MEPRPLCSEDWVGVSGVKDRGVCGAECIPYVGGGGLEFMV